MNCGYNYYSIHEKKGEYVIKQHFWKDNSFDFQMEKEGNVYLDEDVAQLKADDLNKNKKKLYKHCPNCEFHTRNDDGICMDCNKPYDG